MNRNLNYDSIITNIKNNDIKNLYLFYGSETFLINDAVARMEKKVVNPGFKNLNYMKVDGSVAAYDLIVNACETLPFMDEKRMVIINNCTFFKSRKSRDGSDKDDGRFEELCGYFSQMPDTTVLVLIAGEEIDQRTKIFNSIRKFGVVVEFSPLKGQELVKWITGQFDKRNKKIARTEALYMADRVSGGLDDIVNEIDKICSYTGKKEGIEKSDIDAVVSKSLEANIFQLVDSISMKNPGRALLTLNDLLLDLEPVPKILAMIVRQYRLLLNAKLLSGKGYTSSEISHKLGVSPFVASNMLKISGNYTEEQIEVRFKRCLDIDAAIKTGKMNERIAIESLIVEFAG